MEITEKINKTLSDNISYALKRIENGEKEINEGKALLYGALLVAEEMRKKYNAEIEKSVE